MLHPQRSTPTIECNISLEECALKIIEILELSKEKTIAEIAKDHLEIGEKVARQALKQAGCYAVVGQPGWFFDETENEENLQESIYVFADQVKRQQEGIVKAAANLGINEDTNGDPFVIRKRHSFDLDVRLVKQLKLHSVKNDITLYEAVETAIRDYLNRDTL